MADKLQFDLVSPEKLLFSAQVDAVQIPGAEGDFGVLPNHSPVMALIRPGTLVVENDGDVQRFELSGGFVDVTPQGVTVLSDGLGESSDA